MFRTRRPQSSRPGSCAKLNLAYPQQKDETYCNSTTAVGQAVPDSGGHSLPYAFASSLPADDISLKTLRLGISAPYSLLPGNNRHKVQQAWIQLDGNAIARSAVLCCC